MKFRYFKFVASAALALFFSTGIFAQSDREKGLAFYGKADYKNAIKSLKKATKENSADFEGLHYSGLGFRLDVEAVKAAETVKFIHQIKPAKR